MVTTGERKPWHAIFRLLERDERVFAVLLAVVMVGGLATLGLFPLRPRHQINLHSLVLWFALYKVGVFALVTVSPQATRAIFTGALAVDLLLVFVLLYLTGGGYSLFYLLFFPLVAVNAYYFGPTAGLLMAVVAGLLYAMAAWLLPPWVGWIPVVILVGLVGLPAFALGHVAERERRARAEVERLNAELLGTLTRLQAAQEELVVAERMATVGRLSLKVAHEVRNPIAAIELNAELLGDIVGPRPEAEMVEAASLVSAIRDQMASAFDVVIQLNRLSDGSRRIVSISEVNGTEGNIVLLQDIFTFKQTGIDAEGRVIGRAEPTGIRPTFTERLRAYGIELRNDMFNLAKWA